MLNNFLPSSAITEAQKLIYKNLGVNAFQSFATAVGADALNVFANHYHLYSKDKNGIAKEITIDTLYLFLAIYSESLSSASNVTYAIGRCMRYTELLQSKNASYFSRSLGLGWSIHKKGLVSGFLSTACSFAGSRLGYFCEKKIIEPKLQEEVIFAAKPKVS